MTRRHVAVFLLACLPFTLQAAVVVTSEGEGDVSTQYFEKGEFILMQDEQPIMGVDRDGNCWFVEHRRVVADPCGKMQASVKDMREQAMAGLTAEERALMERAMQMQSAAPPASLRKTDGRRIAGYQTECFLIGSDREICISAKLLGQIRKEMGDSPFLEVFRRFGESAGQMGGDSPETKAMAALAERGFPMLDQRKVAAMSGFDPAMLNVLPEAQRARVMREMGGLSGGHKIQGSRVTRVDTDGRMPDLDLSRYPRVGFDEFMRQSLERAGGMMR